VYLANGRNLSGAIGKQNVKKYPVEKSKRTAKKYNEL